MKRKLLVLTVMCLAMNADSQTWNEWFQQKKTQIKYSVEQITALKLYGSAVKKGYDLTKSGLQNIGHLKESDWVLHQRHFASFLQVSKGVKDAKTLQSVVSLQTTIQRINTECRRRLSKEGEFTSGEKEYFSKVLNNALKESEAIGEEAVLLTSDDSYQMSDEERLKKLQALLTSTKELSVFLQQFRSNIATAALDRIRERINAKTVKLLY